MCVLRPHSSATYSFYSASLSYKKRKESQPLAFQKNFLSRAPSPRPRLACPSAFDDLALRNSLTHYKWENPSCHIWQAPAACISTDMSRRRWPKAGMVLPTECLESWREKGVKATGASARLADGRAQASAKPLRLCPPTGTSPGNRFHLVRWPTASHRLHATEPRGEALPAIWCLWWRRATWSTARSASSAAGRRRSWRPSPGPWRLPPKATGAASSSPSHLPPPHHMIHKSCSSHPSHNLSKMRKKGEQKPNIEDDLWAPLFY